MNYLSNLGIPAQPVREKLYSVCDRVDQSIYSAYRFLTSQEAIQTYRFLWATCVALVEITIILGRITRIVWDKHLQPRIDAHVAWALTETQNEPRRSWKRSSMMPAIAMPRIPKSKISSILTPLRNLAILARGSSRGCDVDQDLSITRPPAVARGLVRLIKPSGIG